MTPSSRSNLILTGDLLQSATTTISKDTQRRSAAPKPEPLPKKIPRLERDLTATRITRTALAEIPTTAAPKIPKQADKRIAILSLTRNFASQDQPSKDPSRKHVSLAPDSSLEGDPKPDSDHFHHHARVAQIGTFDHVYSACIVNQRKRSRSSDFDSNHGEQ